VLLHRAASATVRSLLRRMAETITAATPGVTRPGPAVDGPEQAVARPEPAVDGPELVVPPPPPMEAGRESPA
jgi:hypothetical protein